MPFKSEKQRRYLWATHPEVAHKWAYGKHSTKADWGRSIAEARVHKKKKKKRKHR